MHQRLITVNDRMQRGYVYKLVEPEGRNFSPEFRPQLSPAEMLRLGVFGGKYMTDCRHEFPARWFKGAKLAPRRRDPSLNFFGVDASQPLSVWRAKGWIHSDDPRGWFQWYCRYWRGGAWRMMRGRSAVGRRCVGMCARSSAHASGATSTVAHASAKPCCTGHMTAGSSEGPDTRRAVVGGHGRGPPALDH